MLAAFLITSCCGRRQPTFCTRIKYMDWRAALYSIVTVHQYEGQTDRRTDGQNGFAFARNWLRSQINVFESTLITLIIAQHYTVLSIQAVVHRRHSDDGRLDPISISPSVRVHRLLWMSYSDWRSLACRHGPMRVNIRSSAATQRSRATLRVIEYFAKSLKIIGNRTNR